MTSVLSSPGLLAVTVSSMVIVIVYVFAGAPWIDLISICLHIHFILLDNAYRESPKNEATFLS